MKKILKFSIILSGIIFICLLAFYIWLGSDSALKIFAAQTVKALEQKSLKLQYQSIEGKLPYELVLNEVSLSDKDGLLAQSQYIHLSLKPWALLRGILHITELDIHNPQLLRRPSIENKTSPNSSTGLPVFIHLDKLSLTDVNIAPIFINPNISGGTYLNGSIEVAAYITKKELKLSLNSEFNSADDPESQGKLIVQIKPSASGSDQLQLSAALHDESGLILSLINGTNPGSSNLRIEGDGGLDNWKSEISFNSETWGNGQGSIMFSSKNGKLWPDLTTKPDWNIQVNSLITDLPNIKTLNGQLGPEISITADARQNINDFNATISAITGYKKEKKLSAQLSGKSTKLETSALMSAQWTDQLQQQDQINLNADLSISQEGMTIKQVDLKSKGVDIQGNLTQNKKSGLTGAISCDMDFASPAMQKLWTLAKWNELEAKGGLKLDLNLHWKNLNEPANALLKLNSDSLQWPSKKINSILGGKIALSTSLEGGQGSYKLAINNGVLGSSSIYGKALYSGDEEWLKGAVDWDITAMVDDIKPFLPQVAGPVNVALKGHGCPGEKINAALTLSGNPRQNLADFSLNKLLVSIDAEGRFIQSGSDVMGASFAGKLNLTNHETGPGSIQLDTKWAFNKHGTRTSASLNAFTATLPGISLKANISCDDFNISSLNGDMQAKINSWPLISQLSGLDISGSPAKLEAKINQNDKSAHIQIDSQAIKVKKERNQLLSLSQLHTDISIKDISKKEGLSLVINSRQGSAGPAAWDKINIQAQGPSLSGSFSGQIDALSLFNKGGKKGDKLSLNGTYDFAKSLVNLQSFNFSVADSRIALAQAMRIDMNNGLQLENIKATISPNGELTANGHIKDKAAKINATLTNLPYHFFSAFTDNPIPAGEIEYLLVKLQGSPQGPTGGIKLSASADLSKQGLKNLKPSLNLEAHIAGGKQAFLKGQGKIKAAGDGIISFDIPLDAANGMVKITPNSPMNAQLDWHGDAAALWRLAAQPDRSLKGQTRLKATVSGALKNPKVSADLELNKGSYSDKVLGLLISGIEFKAKLKDGQTLETTLEANDAKSGSLKMSGNAANGFKNIEAQGNLVNFAPLNRDDLNFVLSGRLSASGPLSEPLLGGEIQIERGEINLATAVTGSHVRTLNISGPEQTKAAIGPKLDLKVNATNQIFIKGYGLDSEWKINLHIGGKANQASLTGYLAPVRGYFEIFSKQFQFTGGEISFAGGSEIKPSLNLQLANTGPNITALILVSGSADKPVLKLDSRPPYPQDEILSQVLFGKSITRISRMEALQLANGLRELSSMKKGSWNPVDYVRKSLGLDVLRFGGSAGSLVPQADSNSNDAKNSNDEDGIALEAGRYINNDIYVGLEHSPSGGTGVRMEVELTPSISLEGRSSTQSSQVGLGWKRDY